MTTLFSSLIPLILLALAIQHHHMGMVEAVGGSGEEKDRRDTCACLVKEPNSNEKSDSKEDCSAFEPLPPTSPPTPPPSTVGAPATSTAAPTSSSAAPTSSSAAPNSSSSAAPGSSSSAAPGSSSAAPSPSSGAPTGSSPASPPSPSPTGPHFNSRCRLKHALVNISSTLTATEKADFDVLIQEIQDEVLSNPCGCLTDEMKVVKAGKKVKIHLKKHDSVKQKIHYKSLGYGTSKWGHWRDFVQVAVDIQGEKAPNVTELDVNDDCKMFQAIRTCAGSDADDLIVAMRTSLKNGNAYGWSKTQKQAKLHLNFRSFFKVKSQLEQPINDCEIDGFGDVESFRDVFQVAHQTTRLSRVISGKNNSDCELLKRMQEQCDNRTNDETQLTQLNELRQAIEDKFQVEMDLQVRLQFVSQKIFDCLDQSPFVIQLVMDIMMTDNDTDCGCDYMDWGDVYELSYCSHFCTNEDSCGEVDGGEGTPPTGGPSSPTTPAPLSSSGAPSSSSAAPSSSSGAPSSSSGAPSSSSAAPSSSSAAPSSGVPSSAAPSSSSAAPSSAAPSSGVPSSAAPSSSSAAPSSAAPSSGAPSSAAPSSGAPSSAAPSSGAPSSAAPSTTPAPTNCSTNSRGGVTKYYSTQTQTPGSNSWMEYSIRAVYNTWTLQDKSRFNSDFTKIRNCILGQAQSCLNQDKLTYTNYPCADVPGVINGVVGIIQASYGWNVTLQQPCLNADIQGGTIHGFYGKVRNYCGCASA